MARWSWVIADTQGRGLAELTAAQSRSLSFATDAAATASLDIDGRHATAELIDDLATDLLVYRDGSLLFRGRIAQASDTVDADRHRVQVQAADYRALLDRRAWEDADEAYVAEEQCDVAWGLITHTQSQAGGNLGITRGATPTGVTVTRTVQTGRSIMAELDALADAGDADAGGPGFEWTITPELVFDMHRPRRQRTRTSHVLEYGGLVQSFQRSTDPATIANAVRATGDSALTEETREAADVATDTRGRLHRQVGRTDIVVQAELSEFADYLLADLNDGDTSTTATLIQGGWSGPDELWLGDLITFRARSGRLTIDETLRVRTLGIAVGADGQETVTVGFGEPPRKLPDVLADTRARLAELERE